MNSESVPEGAPGSRVIVATISKAPPDGSFVVIKLIPRANV